MDHLAQARPGRLTNRQVADVGEVDGQLKRGDADLSAVERLLIAFLLHGTANGGESDSEAEGDDTHFGDGQRQLGLVKERLGEALPNSDKAVADPFAQLDVELVRPLERQEPVGRVNLQAALVGGGCNLGNLADVGDDVADATATGREGADDIRCHALDLRVTERVGVNHNGF